MKTMGERLASALRARDMDAPALIAAIGSSKGTVYNVLDGTTKAEKIRAGTAQAICDALRIRLEWLLTGAGSMDATAAPSQPTPRDLDRQLLTTAVEAARRETASLRLSDRQFAAVVEMLYDALVRDLEIDRQHDTVAGMLRAFSLEDKTDV